MDQKKRKTRQIYSEKEKTIIKSFLDGQPEGKKYFWDREIRELMNKLDEASGQKHPKNSVRRKLRTEIKKRQLVAQAKTIKKKGPKTLWRIIDEYVKERMSKLKKQNQKLKEKAKNCKKWKMSFFN